MIKYLSRNKKVWALLVAFAMITSSAFSLGGPVLAATSQVTFQKTGGWLESAYAEWSEVTNAKGYNVYYKKSGAADSSYIRIDDMLIRKYPNYYRADAVGLAAGTYVLKVVPIIGSSEDNSKAAVTGNLTVKAHTREGFAFSKNSPLGTGSGAYNDDGTLKSGAQVIYITPDNTASTVKLDVITNAKGAVTSCTGLAEILTARQKGYDKTPLAIRFIGNVKETNMTGLNSSGYLQIKGASAYTEMNMTLEGIGEDATANGWGFLIRNCGNIEIRNFGVMLFPDDGISLDTSNVNIWVHNNDLFYGKAGSDKDQAKGDGSIDMKGNSRFITISYNHFWDSGKASLCGMKSEAATDYITYHHNWFDHSDSRHPRIRTMTVHVYNNYFDGNSKYGIGVTSGASVFSESNYFRSCKYPMLSSLQGTDIIDGVANGTFSGEEGGMIKSYGNYIEGAKRFVDQNNDSVQFDAITVSSKSEKVSSSYKTVSGGHTYNNFDTDSTKMYSYSADNAETGKANTMNYAGRVNGGDFKWTFNNAVDDTNSDVNSALMTAILAYKGSVVSVGGNSTGGQTPTTAPTAIPTAAPTAAPTTAPTAAPTPTSVPSAGSTYTYIADDSNAMNTSGYFTAKGSLTTNGGIQNYDGKSLSKGLKMDSSGTITFTTSKAGATIVVGLNAKQAGSALSLNGSKTEISGITTGALQVKQITLGAAGTYTLSKGTNECYVYYVNVIEK